jgi:hypothetical protein
MFTAVQAIDSFLAESPENVAVIHCKAGRGRTGLVLSLSLVSHFFSFCLSLSLLVALSLSLPVHLPLRLLQHLSLSLLIAKVVASYLLHSGFATDPEEAMAFFALQRSATNEGIRAPSQKRYAER